MSQENVDMIRELYESFGKGDIPAVLGQMDEKIDWRGAEGHIYYDGNSLIGPQAVLDGVFMRIPGDWDGFTVSPEEFLDAGDHVVALGTYTGKYKETGKDLRAQFAHLWGVKGGRVVRFQQFTDTRQFAEVAGKQQQTAVA